MTTPSAREPLLVDLVPRTAWFANLRSELTPQEWQQVKTATYRAAAYRCEKCGGRGQQHPVECHERWDYNALHGVQTLLGTIALCPDCHEATHYGFARTQGRGEYAREWLMHVNGWSVWQVDEHIAAAMREWKARSEHRWTLDARWLLQQFPGISPRTRARILTHAEPLASIERQKAQDIEEALHGTQTKNFFRKLTGWLGGKSAARGADA